jgi:hypothetical protein
MPQKKMRGEELIFPALAPLGERVSVSRRTGEGVPLGWLYSLNRPRTRHQALQKGESRNEIHAVDL